MLNPRDGSVGSVRPVSCCSCSRKKEEDDEDIDRSLHRWVEREREKEVFDGLVLSNRESCVREVKILGELRNLVLNATSEDTYDYEEKI